MFKNKLVLVVILMLALSSGVAAADITLGYVEWDCAISQTHIMAAVLEEYFDYNVEIISVDAGIMWTALAQGDLDGIVCAWLPVTHGFYFEEYGDRVIDLGPNFEGAKIGLVVPEYVDIDNIEDLNDYAREFRSIITGIDPGAGIMAATDEAIDVYDLHLSVLDSSDAAMIIQLSQSIQDKEWIVVTGWVPHWKFDSFDLKFLDDPENVYGGAETINTIVNQDFYQDFDSEITHLFEKFYLTQDQLHEMMNIIREDGGNELELARQWIKDNETVVSEWLK